MRSYVRSRNTSHISNPAEIVSELHRFTTKRQEYFLVVTLDAAHKVIKIHIVTIGLLNRTLVHPREVFVRAIRDHAASIILAHNHPSGELEPSREDKEATTRLLGAGKLIGIEVLDHIIIAKGGYYSFRESGNLGIN